MRDLLVSLAFLGVLLQFSDVPSYSPSAALNRAQQNFVKGFLEDCQRESEDGYRRFLYSNPSLARQFQVLAATAMAFRGLNESVIETLGDDRIPWTAPSDRVQRLSLEAVALTHLHRLSEAEQALVEADKLCASSDLIECGAVLRSHGLLFFERGQTEQSRMAHLASLDFARSRGDGMLEASELQNLGRVATRNEKHDEARAYYEASARKAIELGATDMEQRVLGNEGWEQYTLGNFDKALEDFDRAGKAAALLGDVGYEIRWLTTSALVYADTGQLALAEMSDLRVLEAARQIRDEQQILNASQDLAQVYIDEGRLDTAERYTWQAFTLAQRAGNRPEILYCHMLQGEAAALRHDFPRADALLHEVILAPESQNRMRWNSQHTLARMYEEQGQPAAAEQAYKAAIGLVEAARRDLHQEISRLTFLTNAARIYDDYIHFLVAQGRVVEALDAADWSRARTLQQGLGVIPASADAAMKPPPLRAVEIARRTRSTLLFYWMGERQSYLWAVSPEMTTLLPLPPKAELVAKMQRYRRTILALKDPLRENNGQGDTDARELYQTLLAPVAPMLAANRPVVLFTDGEMTQLNFETLVVPPAAGGSSYPHFWIEDATISSSPSIRLFAAKTTAGSPPRERLLLLGDAPSTDPSLPTLPMAGLEVRKVSERFRVSDEEVFAGTKATPLAYIAAHPERFAYIHFVAHATASGTDPLESAVILARDGEAASGQGAGDSSYKLYASEILQHPIAARLVTISACNSSGTATYAGEGVVGLSWAFLRAGAHNTIAALWDVSDASTPEVMDRLYAGLAEHQPPAAALRKAKLSLLREGGAFARPFYWAPFQLYSGR